MIYAMKLPLGAAIAALNDAEIDYVAVGGLAVISHGHPRSTVDIDIIVRFDRENVDRLIACLRSRGFKPKLPVDPTGLHDPAQRQLWRERDMVALPFFDDKPPWTMIDVFIEHPIDYDDLKAQSAILMFDGVPTRVCGLRHLIKLKEDAGRPKDIEDLRWLFAILDDREDTNEST